MNTLKKQFYLFALFALLPAVLVSILSSSCKRQASVRETVKAMTDCTLSFPLSLNIINADQIEDRNQLSYGGKMKLVMYVPPSKEKRDSVVQAIRNAWFEFPVDESNHITLIGDPTLDPRVLELYIKALSK